MSAKHTPGPWFVVNQYREDDPRGSLVGPRDYPVCSITGYHRDEHSANARLIAAAPDLLEVAHECLVAEEQRRAKLLPGAPATTYCEARIAKIRAAIARAEAR